MNVNPQLQKGETETTPETKTTNTRQFTKASSQKHKSGFTFQSTHKIESLAL